MNKHTAEPWEVLPRESRVISIAGSEASNRIIAHIRFPDDKGGWAVLTTEDEANAARIVACVNACAGVENEELEKLAALECDLPGVAGVGQMAVLNVFYRHKRDELVAALRDLVVVAEATDRGDDEGVPVRLWRVSLQDAVIAARAALARVAP